VNSGQDWHDWLVLAVTTLLGWFAWNQKRTIEQEQAALANLQLKQTSLAERMIAVEHIITAEQATREVALEHISAALERLEAQHTVISSDITTIKVILGAK
jgi:hypothetical protein